jgi:hypothetical protein
MDVEEVESGGRRWLFEFCYVPHHHRACVTRSQLSGPPIDETPPCARAHANWRCPKLPVGGFRRRSTDQPRLSSAAIIVMHRVALDWRGIA